MGRECRRVPAGWEHPVDAKGHYVPLFDGANLVARQAQWDEENAKWALELRRDFRDPSVWVPIEPKYIGRPFAMWDGERPRKEDYTDYAGKLLTSWQYYENTTEGTPLSPVFASAREYADWGIAELGWDADDTAAWVAEQEQPPALRSAVDARTAVAVRRAEVAEREKLLNAALAALAVEVATMEAAEAALENVE